MEPEKKKILYIITQAEWGGAQRYIYDLITSPEAQNYDITLAVGQGADKSLIMRLAGQNIKIYALKSLTREISPWHDLKAILELKNLYREVQPDIIHLNSTKAGIVGSLAFNNWKKRPAGAKLIYTAHGWVFNEPLSPLKRKIYLWLEKYTAKFKDKIICVSQYDRQIALENKIAPIEKLITIHNGIDPEKINFLSREEARAELLTNLPVKPENEEILIGTVANFYPTKGLEYLIEAAALLNENSDKPIYFSIIGDGALREKLENLIANYGLQNKFFLLGKKENASRYLKAFDIYICSSLKEGLPYSILEAAAAGLPIISTDVGGIPEIIINNENGLLIKPINAISIAKQMEYLFNRQDFAKKIGQQAKITLNNSFLQAQMTEKTFVQY